MAKSLHSSLLKRVKTLYILNNFIYEQDIAVSNFLVYNSWESANSVRNKLDNWYDFDIMPLEWNTFFVSQKLGILAEGRLCGAMYDNPAEAMMYTENYDGSYEIIEVNVTPTQLECKVIINLLGQIGLKYGLRT